MLFLNPGAAGQHGFHSEQTALRFKIDGARIYDMEVIQMPRIKVKLGKGDVFPPM
jgi:hypothetical protein